MAAGGPMTPLPTGHATFVRCPKWRPSWSQPTENAPRATSRSAKLNRSVNEVQQRHLVHVGRHLQPDLVQVLLLLKLDNRRRHIRRLKVAGGLLQPSLQVG